MFIALTLENSILRYPKIFSVLIKIYLLHWFWLLWNILKSICILFLHDMKYNTFPQRVNYFQFSWIISWPLAYKTSFIMHYFFHTCQGNFPTVTIDEYINFHMNIMFSFLYILNLSLCRYLCIHTHKKIYAMKWCVFCQKMYSTRMPLWNCISFILCFNSWQSSSIALWLY